MSLPHSPPPLPKWPFLVADLTLLGAAWFIADQAHAPLSSGPLLALVVCLGGAAVAGAIPFLVEYARKQDEALDDRQRSLEALATTVAAAADQISIAAGGFQEIAELAQKNLKHAETLPQKLQEKIAEFEAQRTNAAEEEKEELERELAVLRAAESERLEAIADKIARAAADWAKAEAAAHKQVGAAKAVLAEFDRKLAERKSALTAPEPAEASRPVPPPPVPEAAPAAEAAAVPAPAEPPPAPPAAPTAEPPAVAAGASEPGEGDTPPRKKRPPKKAAEAAEPVLGLEGIDAPAPEFTAHVPEDVAPTVSLTADGATRLIVTAYIGIGNRLFIRGEGPGLSWEEGVPLQFVSIGKWRWETAEAGAPVRFKLYKNDQTECTSLAAQAIEPGHQQELTATF